MKNITTDFLVIGSGVAGLRAAVELVRQGEVIVVTKDIPTESSTEYAQGGVAVALSDEDEVGIHFEDTIKAGDGLCREEAVKVLVEEGPERILELIEWGAEFDKEGTKPAFTIEAAHSRRRILHAHGDSTGKELERVLINKIKSFKTIRRMQFSTAVDLIIEDGRCKGAYVLKDGEIIAVCAKSTLLATGGAGQVFSRTTNPAVVTGDGMAIAYRAGAVLEDMEFVQFHPTVLFAPAAPQFLLSEAMRGEGAILRNIFKETFMKNYHPDAELAPRDIVSRAIISEMVKTNNSHVYLDLTHRDAGFIKKRFPMIYSTCLRYDLNITKDLIPVSPAAHYMMGGIKTDLNGATNIKGLYAAGEVACTGVHGANRLASNSLLEGLVYGYRAGVTAAPKEAEIQSSEFRVRETPNSKTPKGTVPDLRTPTGVVESGLSPSCEEVRTSLRRLMWEKVGIIRCGVSLNDAVESLSKWKHILDMDFSTRRGLELKNMLTVALLITESSLAREGSIGAHYRSDFKERGEDRQRHISVIKTTEGIKAVQSCVKQK
ncbi:MAG: L-aspartate oxidase [Nitrospirae bacterium GWB2_47_37]|nr:MAG: L-aspartate oxidase [Nitrospirae bacterium GWA2_46_11]OGW22870.1 MAG: L-aspartate oxidase [Nitrospirae bacterium GWB2_47_37]